MNIVLYLYKYDNLGLTYLYRLVTSKKANWIKTITEIGDENDG